MPRPCSCCVSPHHAKIDAGLVAGVAAAVLARQYGVTDDAVHRHKVHLPASRRDATPESADRGDALLSQVRQLHGKAVSLLLAAEKAGDLRGAMSGIREAARTLELVGRLQGQIGTGDVTVNVIGSPVFVGLQQTIMVALEQFPEARQAVVMALSGQKTIEG